MQNQSTTRPDTVRPCAAPGAKACRPRKEDEAAQLMWDFYKPRKAQLIADIKEYRAAILSGLMQGLPVDQVFAPYVKPPEPTRPAKRTA
ncbi:MAG: hypothetical protein J0M00_23935 [Burkholderiales bacterium]|nr:hypothetical protein [Burkholderiales bacterium]